MQVFLFRWLLKKKEKWRVERKENKSNSILVPENWDEPKKENC